ncbi:hypothetical protein DL93DRAFT_2076108 [Clavulina sp. PMI_390]|nr:hypothetical protein DL93DRAFT_2076108 [Clavulina sp. PMI_390]
MGSKRRVAYYYDEDIGSFSYGWAHPMKPFRIRLAHSLIAAYDMLPKLDVIRAARCTPKNMTRFHTDEYVDFLSRVTPETAIDMTGGGARFLSGDDNPAFDGVFDFSSISAGGSIAAAERINSGMSDIAINWAGGLHHAKKGEGSGFCYINDIVLGILELLRFHSRVLYIDIDFHHGDGVEEAFYSTDRVLTCSFHKQKDSFPGTGKLGDRGIGRGKGYSVNVPLLQGCTDEDYRSMFEPVIQRILDWFRPEAVVLQCGADSLSEDKLGCFNLSMHGHADCVRFLRSKNLPLILLGGGGYTVRNVACAWTYETAIALGIENDLSLDVPYSDYLEWYGPRYKLEIRPSNLTNDNHVKGYLEKTKIEALAHLNQLPFAPSVAQHQTPHRSVARELGLVDGDNDGEEDDEDLDVQIRRSIIEQIRLDQQASSSRQRRQRRPRTPTSDNEDEDEEMEDGERGGEGDSDSESVSSSSSSTFQFRRASSRNIYHPPPAPLVPLSRSNRRANGHVNGNGDGAETDEEIHISEEDEDEAMDEDDDADGRHANHRKGGAHTNGDASLTSSSRNGNGRGSHSTRSGPHQHGTRSAMAAATSSLLAGLHPEQQEKRSFFTSPYFPSGARLVQQQRPVILNSKPRLWDGTPVVEMPYRAPPGVYV